MRFFFACLAGGCMLMGAVPCSGAAQSASGLFDAEGEAACCAAMLSDDAVERFSDGDGGGPPVLRPQACFQHGCPAMMWDAPNPDRVNSPSEAAIRQQVELRAKPACHASEWRGRCPAGSAMILANRHGGCAAAGCLRLEGDEWAVFTRNDEEDDDATFRAVVAQEAERLHEAGIKQTFYRRSLILQKEFEKSQKKLLRGLQEALEKVPTTRDVEDVQLLLERAAKNGYEGVIVDEARKAVLRHDGEQKALAYLRRLPGVVLSRMARKGLQVKRDMDAKESIITGLEEHVERLITRANKVEQAAAADGQRFAEARLAFEAKLDAGDVRERELRAEAAKLASILRREQEVTANAVKAFEAKLATMKAAAEEELHRVEDLTRRLEASEKHGVARQGEIDAKEKTISGLEEEARSLAATVEVLQQAAAADGQRFAEARDGLRKDVGKPKARLAAQAEAMETSEEDRLFLEEELGEWMETSIKAEDELDDCHADLLELDSASADLFYAVSLKILEEGAVVDVSPPLDIYTTLERYSPREDRRVLPQRLRLRLVDIKRALGSLTEKAKANLESCARELREVRKQMEYLDSSSSSSSGGGGGGGGGGGTATGRDPSETGPSSGHEVGHEHEAEHGALWGDASAPQPEGDDLGFRRLQVPPAG